MARSTPQQPTEAVLSVDQMRQGITRINRRIDDLNSFDIGQITERFDPLVGALEKSIEETLQRVFGANTIEYQRYASAAIINPRSIMPGARIPISETQEHVRNRIVASCATLTQAVKGLTEEVGYLSEPTPIADASRSSPSAVTRQTDPPTAPASDRVVRLDHNSVAYIDANDALDEVEDQLRNLANATDAGTHARLTDELAAGRTLFRSPLVRVALVGAVLGAVLTTISVTFHDFGISLAASAAWTLVVACFHGAAKSDG